MNNHICRLGAPLSGLRSGQVVRVRRDGDRAKPHCHGYHSSLSCRGHSLPPVHRQGVPQDQGKSDDADYLVDYWDHHMFQQSSGTVDDLWIPYLQRTAALHRASFKW